MQEDYKKSYFDSSIVPRDYTRHTYISKDNCFYFNGMVFEQNISDIDEKVDPMKEFEKSRNLQYLQSKYASALEK